jgi:hypothetical protein
VVIHETFNINADSGSAFVQDGELRAMVKQSGHSNSLLLSAAQHVCPILHGIPTSLTFYEVGKLNLFEEMEKHGVIHTLGKGVDLGVGVEHLIPQRAQCEIRPLGYVKQLRLFGLGQHTSKQRPEFAKNPEQAGFTTTIGTTYLFFFLHMLEEIKNKYKYKTRTSTFMPDLTSKERDRMRTSPLGVTTGTLSNLMM